MSEQKWTPGDWTVMPLQHEHRLQTGGAYSVVALGKHPHVVANVQGVDEEAKANARLIAAAKALVEALQDIAAMKGKTPQGDDDIIGLEDAADRAHAVLRHIYGEEE